jgi:uncharacterized protein with PQ loop repeat
MNWQPLVEWLGVVGSAMLAVCALPLVVDVVRNRTARAIPWLFLLSWGVGEIYVGIYGLFYWLKPVLLNVTFNLLAVFIILYYKVGDVGRK